jgi:phage pi2 protein 07
MEILDQLVIKLNIMSDKFQLLKNENKKLKAELNALKNQNDLFTKSSQDVTLAIRNILHKDGKL